jgi:hypothetical protein
MYIEKSVSSGNYEMKTRELIPKHKDDQKVVEGLKKLSFGRNKTYYSRLIGMASRRSLANSGAYWRNIKTIC